MIQRCDDMREKILKCEDSLRAAINAGAEEVICPPEHVFSDGQYARTVRVPAGVIIVTKLHKKDHVTVFSQGSVLVATEEGACRLDAPLIFKTEAGTKRVVYTLTDVVWTTVHKTDKTDLDDVEADLIAESYDAFDAITTNETLTIGG